MKSTLDIISKILATYFLVLSSLYFGIHSWDHDHDHEIKDYYHHSQQEGTNIFEEPVDCSFCNLYEKHTPYFDKSGISQKAIESRLLDAFQGEHIPDHEPTFLHLRGPPAA